MRAGTYRFHCTDGTHAVLDLSGRYLRARDNLRAEATRAARAIMRRVAGRLDWSAWIVDVHDAGGYRVLTLAFEEAGPAPRAVGPAESPVHIAVPGKVSFTLTPGR